MKGRKPSELSPGTISEVPRPPSWLSREAKAEWKRIVPDLVARRTLTPADMGQVESLCIALGDVKGIERDRQAATSIDLKLKLARLQNQRIAVAKQLAGELGATPVARTRIGGADTGDNSPDFLGNDSESDV